jgi:hypothetical protein
LFRPQKSEFFIAETDDADDIEIPATTKNSYERLIDHRENNIYSNSVNDDVKRFTESKQARTDQEALSLRITVLFNIFYTFY